MLRGRSKMERCVYRAQIKPGAGAVVLNLFNGMNNKLKEFINTGEIMTLSVFKWNDNIFTYYECIDRIIKPEEIFGDISELLEKWPGEEKPRCWVPMMDIYHCCEPISAEYWKRKEPVKRVCARLNRLKPEMVSSYIFYHYQYQEELPGDWAKYPSIFLHENLMFFYTEEPDAPEKTPYSGKLNTSNTPGQWQDLMDKHFYPWEDDPELKKPWKEIEQVIHL